MALDGEFLFLAQPPRGDWPDDKGPSSNGLELGHPAALSQCRAPGTARRSTMVSREAAAHYPVLVIQRNIGLAAEPPPTLWG
jgi:hypothetical protein